MTNLTYFHLFVELLTMQKMDGSQVLGMSIGFSGVVSIMDFLYFH